MAKPCRRRNKKQKIGQLDLFVDISRSRWLYVVGEIISQSLVNSLPYGSCHGKESRVVTRSCFVELNGKIFGKWTVIICNRSLENLSLNCPMEFFILLQCAAFLVCFLHLWSVDRLFTSQIFVGII